MWRVRAVALVLVLVATACGSSQEGTADRDGDGDESSSAPSGTVRFGANRAFTTFDVHTAVGTSDTPYWRPVYDALLTHDDEGNLAPGLATEWAITPQELSLTIREGVTFSDGTALDAEAVAANLRRAAEQPDARSTMGQVSGITTPDPSTVVVAFAAPNAGILDGLTGKYGFIMSPSSLADPELDLNPVGTGGWIFDAAASVPDASYVYSRNPDYWNPSVQGVETVEIHVLTDAATMLNALRTGEIDVASLGSEQAVDALAAGFEAESVAAEMWMIYVLDGAGTKWAPFGSAQVREAMSLALDREGFVSAVLRDQGEVATQPYAEGRAGHVEDWPEDEGPDLDAARELLADAGYPDGFSFPALATPVTKNAAEALGGMLAEIGIDMQIELVDAASYLSQLRGGASPVYVNQWPLDDPSGLLSRAFVGVNASQNPFKRPLPDSEAAATALQSETDPKARAQLGSDMVEGLIGDHTMIVVAYNDKTAAYRDGVTGIGWPYLIDTVPPPHGVRVD